MSGEPVEVRLAPESVEELAARLAEALGRAAGDEDGGARGREDKISAAEVARRWGVARRWVYDHADALGARRLGDGPRPRLRFDPDEVAERLGRPRPVGSRSDRRQLPPMRANPHSDSLSAPHRATVGGKGKVEAGGADAPGPAGRRANAPGPAPKDKHRASAR